MALTGQRLKGEEVAQVGLADYYVKRENLGKLENDILGQSQDSLTVDTLHDIVKKYKEPITYNYKYEQLVQEYFGKSSVNEIYEGLKSSSTNKEFCENSIKLLDQASPLSLKVIYEQIKRGHKLDLAENFKMDFRLSQR